MGSSGLPEGTCVVPAVQHKGRQSHYILLSLCLLLGSEGTLCLLPICDVIRLLDSNLNTIIDLTGHIRSF